MFRSLFAKVDRVRGRSIAYLTSLALVTLNALIRFTGFLNVLMLTGLKLAMVWAGFVWEKIFWLGKLFHPSPSDWFAQNLLHLSPALKRETISNWSKENQSFP
jgi:hypothetical protein